MSLSHKFHTTALFLLIFPVFPSADQLPPILDLVSITIDHDDGGKTGTRHMRNLLASLNEGGCSAILHDGSTDALPHLTFDSRPVSVARNERSDYKLIAKAKTLDGQLSVRGAILVHASTGIDELSSLKGERIAFVGKKSWAGYHLPLQLLRDADVTEHRDTFFFVGNHVGTVSMLLHSDVFVAVTAEPLAQRWAQYNDLSIVAVTDEVETGGWWIHRSLSDEQIHRCAQALSTLDNSRHKALPAWIDGFDVLR